MVNRFIQTCIFLCLSATVLTGAEPPWNERQIPHGLQFSLEKLRGPGIAGRAVEQPDYKIPRAGTIDIDAKFDDWTKAKWIVMDRIDQIMEDSRNMLALAEKGE